MLYLVESTEENTRIVGEKIIVFDYPDGTLTFKYGYRTLSYKVYDKNVNERPSLLNSGSDKHGNIAYQNGHGCLLQALLMTAF